MTKPGPAQEIPSLWDQLQEILMKRGRRSQEDSRCGTEGPWYEHQEER